MQHPHITTHHIYHASDAAIYQARRMADLTFEFGCGSCGYTDDELLHTGRRFLMTLQEHELLLSATEHRRVLGASILEEVSHRGSHMILVLHHRLDAGYGWKCLIPQNRVFEVSEVLSVFGLRFSEAAVQAGD